jgi:transcriptional regulator of acetoin/glycerol metabolism
MAQTLAEEIRRVPDDAARVARTLDALESTLEPGEIVPLERLRELYVRAVVRVHGGNMTEAAKALGVSRWSVYRWIGADEGARRAVRR